MTKAQQRALEQRLAAMTPDARADFLRQKAEAEEAGERDRVSRLSDAQVLELTNNGALGAGIVGKALAERAARVKATTNDGQFGPAITDPHFAEKEKARRDAERRAADQGAAMGAAFAQGTLPDHDRREDHGEGLEGGEVDPTDPPSDPSEESDDSDSDPWRFTTLSGAKLLAQHHTVSYRPGIKKAALIELLKDAGVQPPPPPEDADAPEAPEHPPA